jgi:uncharacterized protein YfaS (alpha-2-macroglobulin family)
MARSTKLGWIWMSAAVLAAAGVGCKEDGGPGGAPPGSSETPPAETPSGTAEEAGQEAASTEAPAPTTLAALHPVISEQAAEGLPPEKLVVALSRPVAPDDGGDLSGTRLTLEPDMEGTLQWEGPSTLAFIPRGAWRPNTEYKATLSALDIRGGVVTAEQPITRVFRTPAFRWVRADLVQLDARQRRASVDLVFSGPVSAAEVQKRLTVKTAGGEAVGAYFASTDRAHVVRLTAGGRWISAGIKLRLALAAGVPILGDTSDTAPKDTRTVELPDGKEVTIHAASLEEGSTGFFVRVVCSDDAFSTDHMYYWDEKAERSFQVSRRCILDEDDAKDSLHFDPPVKFSLSPTRGGFRILGDFARGSYTMRIDADARSADGGVVKGTFQQTFSVPARAPQISFLSQGRYLPRQAWKSLGVRHMNLDKARLEVRHVGVQNLVFWMSADSETATERNSDLILDEKLSLSGNPDQLTTSWVDVATMMPSAPRGVLALRVYEPDGRVEARARILVTDINLVAKHEAGTQQTRVWALDIHTGEPLSGVQVRQVTQSGRVLAECNTSGVAGCAVSNVAAGAVDKAPPFALVAQKGTDLTYLKYSELQARAESASNFGRPFKTEAPYTAVLYSDRGVYRPGETAHVVGIVRDQAAVAPPAGMPLALELVDPRGKVTKRFTEKANGAGMVAVDLKFADYADTGRYAVRVSAGKKVIGSYDFNVEEFVPERMKVKARPSAQDVLLTDTAEVEVDAQYLFGGSAEGSRYEVTCQLSPARFSPPTHGEYEYGVWFEKDPQPIALGSASGVLEAGGIGKLSCPTLNSRGSFAGPARLDVQVAVFESGSGRTTQTQTHAFVHPARYYVGLSASTEKAKAGEPVEVKGVVVDWTGKKVDAVEGLAVRVFRVEREHDWVYDESEGSWNYRQYSRLAKEQDEQVKVKGGQFSLRFTPASDAAAFVIRAEAGPVQADLQIEGHAPYWWSWVDESGQDVTPRPLKPATLPLEVAGPVKVGEELEVKFTPPFKGRALVSLETDEVLSYAWLEVEAKPTSWKVKVPRFAPNVYASVFVVKDPHLESPAAFVPNRAFGLTSVDVVPEAYVQALNMSTPEEVRSSSPLTVKLDLGDVEGPMYVTVAAVDEGILQLTRFESPDPLKGIFDHRSLGVDTFETIGWNLLLPAGDVGRSAGGDAGGDGPGRVQPIKPVALWSGLLEVPKGGKLEVTFDVPQYRGSLRVMAVAAGPKRVARASANVLVRDPLVLQTTLPRFLTQNDEAQVPVFVTNVSGSRRAVKVRIEAKPIDVGGLYVAEGLAAKDVIQVAGEPERSLVLEHEKSGTVVFKLVAKQPVGAATLKVVVSSDDLRSEESLDLPFLPAAPKSRVVQRLELEDGKLDILPHLTGWMPTTERSTFWVTANPYGDAFDHLKYLIRYPYGCIEQTTSSTRPLLFAGQLLSNVDPTLLANGKLDDMVMHGVNRVLSMQTPEGGFSYWPGASEPVPWGTAYGLHMLLDAQKRRYPVPQERIDDALAWVERTLTNRYGSGRTRDWYYGRQAEAYLHYVLASAGKGRKARMLKLLEEIQREAGSAPDGEAAEDLYMLQAGLFMAGDRRFEAQLRKPDVTPLTNVRQNSWSFYTDRRRRGFMLSTYADLFGADPAAEPLAQLVAEGLRGHHSGWYTTQELVWGVTGLGKYVGELTKRFTPPKLLANGKSIAAQDVEVRKASGEKEPPDTGERTWSLYRASEYKSLALEVEKAADQKIFLIISSEGVRGDAAYQTGGEGLGLSRTYRSASGEPVELSSLTLGDVLYAEVEVTNKTGERIQNIALVDRFPAGWEIENPRLSRGGGAIEWLDRDTLWDVDYMNLRDDRVELFGAVEARQSRTFVYVLRAVTAGRFTTPPVEAEAMYDPTRWAREAGGEVVVRGPWETAE